VALELAEAVASFPLAASFAIAGGISLLREGRRRSSLNEAVHELRRPLQVLALSLPADAETTRALDSSLRMAAAAVDRLDHEINGGRVPGASAPIALRSVVEAAAERWRPRAALTGRPLSLDWRSGDPLVRGDGIELDQAVDNMISNAFEHGSGEVTVAVREDGDRLDVVVLDGGDRRPPSPHRGRQRLRARPSRRNRHGHGLRVVRRVAARHGGSFRLRRLSGCTEARLELPLEGGSR
jgi:two-component system, OmpR family, sensor histidine kinase TctE